MIRTSLKVFDTVFKDRFKHRAGNVLLQCFLFTIFLTFTFFFFNINNYLKKTSSSVVFYAFFKKGASSEGIALTKKAISNWPEVSNVKTISQNEGLELLKKSLGREGTILNTLESNPLPYTLEINIKPEFTDKEYLAQINEKLKKYEQLEWFDSTEKFISPLLQIRKYTSLIFSLGTVTVIFLILLTLRTTNRIFFFKYKNAFSLLELLGARKSFIVFPLIFEGFLELLFSSSISSVISFYLTLVVKEELSLLNIKLATLPITFYVCFILLFSLIGAVGGLSLKNREL